VDKKTRHGPAWSEAANIHLKTVFSLAIAQQADMDQPRRNRARRAVIYREEP